MAFKVVIALALIAVVNAGFLNSPYGAAIGSTQENVVRSFGGTVSQYSKAVDTPFSRVRKSDTRVSSNVYAPALATQAITYAAPAPAVYAHSVPTVYAHGAPLVAKTYSPAATVAHVTFDGFGSHYVY